MRTITIDVENRSALHDLFEKELGLPYGRTLDALHDRLCTLREELLLVLPETALCQALSDRYYDSLLRMLTDTAEENPKLHIKIETA